MALTPGFRDSFMKLPPSPHVEAFSMENMSSSTSPTAALHANQYSPTEKDYATQTAFSGRRVRLLHWCRIGLNIIILGAGAAIVGTEAHVLHTYNETHLSNQWFLPLWPQHFDLRPTIGILIGGATIAATSLTCLICDILSELLRQRNLFLKTIILVCSLLGLAGAVFGTAYGSYIYNHSEQYNRDTLLSWTCRWYNGASADSVTSAAGTASVGNNGGITAPGGFARLCLESHAGFDLVVIMVAFETLVLAISIAGWRLERIMN